MRPMLHPMLVNGRTGDPALYVETLFERRAILFDLGDIAALSPRKVQRLEHVFVSHAHIDHFVGFDRLLRLLVGREKTIRLYGPEGFIDNVHHKLRAYRWNLVDRYLSDLSFVVTEINSSLATRTARFRLKAAFVEEPMGGGRIVDGVISRADLPGLDRGSRASHPLPWLRDRGGRACQCLEEPAGGTGIAGRPLAAGAQAGCARGKAGRLSDPDCRHAGGAGHGTAARAAARRSDDDPRPEDRVCRRRRRHAGQSQGHHQPRSKRRPLVHRGCLCGGGCASCGRARAPDDRRRRDEIARDAGVRRVEPFHFSPRYSGEEERMLAEVMAAFSGGTAPGAL